MIKKQKLRKVDKGIAISQILLLIVSLIAFGYVVSSEFKIVSAAGTCTFSVKPNSGQETTVTVAEEDAESFCASNTNKYISCQVVSCSPDSSSSSSVLDKAQDAAVTGITGAGLNRALDKFLPLPSSSPNTVNTNIFSGAKLGEAGKSLPADNIFSNQWKPPTLSGGTTPLTTEGANPGFWAKYLGSKGTLSNTLATAGVTTAVVAVYTYISTGMRTGDWARAKDEAIRVSLGAGAAIGATYGVYALLGAAGPAGWVVAGAALFGTWASKFLSRDQDRTIIFECKPWQAQTGGENCELCNKGLFPCTEYQCKSLGTGCEIINKDTDEPRCVFKNPRDVNPPQITPLVEALLTGYKYDPLPAGQNGVEILYDSEECLPAFTPFSFGVETDKDSYCRISFERTSNFSEMKSDFGGSNIFVTKHKQILSFPGVANIQDYLDKLSLEEGAVSQINNDGEYELYVRCQAASNGKANLQEFAFKFCVDKGPDTSAPKIQGFNWADNSPIAYFGENEQREVGVQVYTNEPSQCKWSHEDKEYKDMENPLTCSDSLLNFNAQLSYTCSGKLTGLQNNKKNNLFFRCEDTAGNVNGQSRKLTLQGTQPLVIDEVSPNNTIIRDSTNSIKVTFKAKTSAGFNNGDSICYSSDTGNSGTYVKFSNTESYKHETNLWLGEGNYDYFVRCIDSAGNADTEKINFTIETDTEAPIVVRAFHQETSLKLITDENATCVYDNFDCNYAFEDGIGFTETGAKGGIEHSTEWTLDKNFYVKCADEFGNQPAPNECNIIVRPSEI